MWKAYNRIYVHTNKHNDIVQQYALLWFQAEDIVTQQNSIQNILWIFSCEKQLSKHIKVVQ
jgi:hypothetical protein